ncbi:MAG: tetratricopeptide repeat protein [Crocinitomicaceae bacterium]|nr:tetratricopeptide repeat protein [Crocinitomicaceae bacterium]
MNLNQELQKIVLTLRTAFTLKVVCFIMLLNASNSFAANNQIDSLRRVVTITNNPEIKAEALFELGNYYFENSNDTALYYFEQAYDFSLKTGNVELQSDITYQLGATYLYIDPVKSAQYTLQSVAYADETKDPERIAASRNALGNLYRSRGEMDKAMQEYKFALKVAETARDSLHIARCYNNIGIVHMMQAEYDTGLDYWLKSLNIKMQMGEEKSAAVTMANIALYYKDIGRYFEAKEMLDKSLQINLANKDFTSVAFCYVIIGDMYWRMDNPYKAVPNYKKSLAYSDSADARYDKEEAFLGLSRVLDSLGKYNEALYYQREYTYLVMDRLSEANNRITRELTTKFETDKKEKQNQLLKSKNDAKDAKIALKEANNRYLIIGLILAGLILILIVFVLTRVRAAKKEIESQKNLVEEKNQEITDSITYAQRLQNAILPTEAAITSNFQESFVLYLPKDIVAGDFYWMESAGDKVLFAVADCTGHGVPGAMVSVVCNNALDRAVNEFGLSQPGEILNKVTDLVIETFERSTEEVKDGMDIGLCSFDFKSNTVEFAGANNGLYHVSDGELHEIKATKQPVGKYSNRFPFENHVITFKKGDIFYLFTDGFADQFGGDKGKKMKYKPFKKMILANSTRGMRAQKTALLHNFERWKADYDQIDDVCVVGIRV